ncbi:hypothetical protein N658DRAFT_92013 [Parathielavia hyrcaniae]|uniref:Uncharacterized protein n=1 Tax=Parathielavia hyrcaniae TaxID=113614 RepID=A0AAN6PZD8_9PEZI|nr:hypothetical protein N658DRAFT_92013 [Parathielavia hyrcaniae]
MILIIRACSRSGLWPDRVQRPDERGRSAGGGCWRFRGPQMGQPIEAVDCQAETGGALTTVGRFGGPNIYYYSYTAAPKA